MAAARNDSTRLLVFVTGLSGAGRSTAVAALEDLGFFCIDNLPSPVVGATLDTLAAQGVTRIAFGIDVRVGAFFDSATNIIDAVREAPGVDVQVLFLDASDEALLRRFGSTRRPHPLNAPGMVDSLRGPIALLEGIGFERTRLSGLRDRATTVVDTTTLNVHELRRRVIELYGPEAGKLPKLRTRITSFGFKYGVPIDADLMFDVRFLRNPYFVEELRHFTGLEREVSEFVLADDEAKQYLVILRSFVDFCLPRFESEGRSYLTLAIGCTGGQHRSVAVAEALATHLRQYSGRKVDVVHRDAERNRHSDRPTTSMDRGTI